MRRRDALDVIQHVGQGRLCGGQDVSQGLLLPQLKGAK